jgi:anaerobic selenocysteine-containing dehydrogenase
MKSFITTCPRNCYSTCSFVVKTENGKVVKIEADPDNKAVPEGPCLKGLSYVERVHSKDRILYPLRKTKRGFSRISWDDALDEISFNLNKFRAEHGPHSILWYYSSGMSGMMNEVSRNFWKMFGGATTVYGNLCWPAGLEASKLCLGENKHNVPWDLENARLIILWGKNPAECNIQQMIPIEKAQKKGAKLVVIDPRKTPSAARADLLIQPKNGSDGILALAIAKIIIEENKTDRDFIDKYVFGFEEFGKSLESLNIKSASESCGIPESLIRKLAGWVSGIKPMTLIAGYGMQRYSNGGQTTRCLLSLPVITGNIGVSGGGWQYANLQSYVFDKIKEPDTYFPDPEADLPFRRTITTSRLAEGMLQASSPDLKMAWVERGNPLAQNPDSNKLYKAFRELEFRVVVEQFMTDTALEADIILPAKSMFEQSDIIGSYWNPYVSFKQKVIEPPGETKPESEIYRLLADKLGFDKEETDRNIPQSDDSAIDSWLKNKLKKFPELDFERLKKGPLVAPGLQEIAFEDKLFPTPSGKIELFSEEAQKKWGVDPLPAYVPLEGNKDYPLFLMSPNTKNRIHSQFGNLEVIKMLDPGPHAAISLKDADERNIMDGDRIRIFNHIGELFMLAKVDYSIRPGNIVIFNGYWNQNEGSPNMLTKGKETDMGHGSAFHDTRVEVERLK